MRARNRKRRIHTLDSASLLEAWKLRQRDREANPHLYVPRSTGLVVLDSILDGGPMYGDYVIIGGAQKMGKSTLLQAIAQHMGRYSEPFIFFSGEMTNMAMTTRLVCSITGIDKSKVRKIELDEHDWQLIESKGGEIEEYTAWWSYGFNTIDHIRDEIERIHSETNIFPRTIFVDYVQLMSYFGPRTRQEQLSALSREFKALSLEMEKPMLVYIAAQLNRESVKNHLISANAFLGTGDFERDMDIGVIIHPALDEADNNRELPGFRQITVVGSRETGLGTCRVYFNGKTSTIKDDIVGEETDLDYFER